LFADLARETSTLVRQELRQAGTEIGQRASGVGKDVGLLAAGAAIGYAAFLALVAAIIAGLADIGLDWWLAALLVSVVLGGLAYVAIARARAAIKQADLIPHHAMENLKEDQEWAKEQIS
jgi:predicted phage tail protein